MNQNEGGMPQIFGDDPAQVRPVVASAMRGLTGKCPACGNPKLFRAFLKPVDHCQSCGEDLSHQRSDDLPPYLNIFITGHVLVGLAMYGLIYEVLPLWWLTGISIAIALVMSVAIMQPLKGMVIGLQWALRMHGFGGGDGRATG